MATAKYAVRQVTSYGEGRVAASGRRFGNAIYVRNGPNFKSYRQKHLLVQDFICVFAEKKVTIVD